MKGTVECTGSTLQVDNAVSANRGYQLLVNGSRLPFVAYSPPVSSSNGTPQQLWYSLYRPVPCQSLCPYVTSLHPTSPLP